MVARILTVFGIGLLAGFFFALSIYVARGNHNVYLPVTDTPFIRSLMDDGTVTWCTDTRATNYPGFRAQLTETLTHYEEAFGVTFQPVAWGAGCEFQHNMPDFVNCSGCAAHIFYANSPVVVEYIWQKGFTDWRSAQAHETGHAFSLHERYRDSTGSIGCGGPENGQTVMDCGPPYVKLPLALDEERVCALHDWLTGCQPEPPVETWPKWDGVRWQFANGTAYVPSTQQWERLSDTGEWVPEYGPCRTWQETTYRQNFIRQEYLTSGSSIWTRLGELAYFSSVPSC